VIEGLEIARFTRANFESEPTGVFITSGQGGTASERITLRRLHIHHVGNYDAVDPLDVVSPGADGNAHAIAVYGNRSNPLNLITIEECDIHHVDPQNSEVISINGNVTHFQVLTCLIHDCSNIGIDAIGHEASILNDQALNIARQGLIRGNTVYNISASTNPAYNEGLGEIAAGGIYCDGAASIIVERNSVHHCDIGIELACENPPYTTDAITLRDNVIYANTIGGLYLGAYDAEQGGTSNCQILNNTFYGNDTRQDGAGECLIRDFTTNCVFRRNVMQTGAQGLAVAITATSGTTGNVFNHNVYFGPFGASTLFLVPGVGQTVLAGWKATMGQDAAAIVADPLFTAPAAATPNFHLQLTSPAIDLSDPADLPAAGELDIDGSPRLTGPRLDAGADELRGYDAWRKLYFPTNPTAANTQPTADADGDKLSNLIEYALGSSPQDRSGRSSGTTASRVTVAGQNYAALSWSRPLSATDLVWTLEGTSTFATPWPTVTGVEVSRTTTATTETLTVRESTPRPASRALRVRFALAP
jgi:hypothetical protein